MRNTILRFVAAIAAVIAAGLAIYFMSPETEKPVKKTEQTKSEKQEEPEFKVDLPKINLDKQDAKEGPQLNDLKKSANSMHATMNQLATEGAFDGAALNTGKIKQDLEKMNTQIEATKSGCSHCAGDITKYMTELQQLSKQASEGDAQALGQLYSNISAFDKQLNGLQALADVRDLNDLFDQKKAEHSFTSVEQWIQDAKARLDAASGDLQMANPQELKAKAAEAERRLQEAKENAKKAQELADKAKDKGLSDAERKQLQLKADEARKKAEQLQSEAKTAQDAWKQMQSQIKNIETDRKEFAKNAQQYADIFSKDADSAKAKAQLDRINQLSKEISNSKQVQQQKIDELQKAFEQLQTLQNQK